MRMPGAVWCKIRASILGSIEKQSRTGCLGGERPGTNTYCIHNLTLKCASVKMRDGNSVNGSSTISMAARPHEVLCNCKSGSFELLENLSSGSVRGNDLSSNGRLVCDVISLRQQAWSVFRRFLLGSTLGRGEKPDKPRGCYTEGRKSKTGLYDLYRKVLGANVQTQYLTPNPHAVAIKPNL